jgi:hypothetical protein
VALVHWVSRSVTMGIVVIERRSGSAGGAFVRSAALLITVLSTSAAGGAAAEASIGPRSTGFVAVTNGSIAIIPETPNELWTRARDSRPQLEHRFDP